MSELRKRGRTGVIVLIVAAAFSVPFWVAGFLTFQLAAAFSYAIALLGLTLITGRAGLVSIGHSASFGVGAYTGVVLIWLLHLPYGWAIPAGAVTGFIFGALVGLPITRLSKNRQSMVIVTLALAIAMPQILKRFPEYTGGTNGVNLPTPAPPSVLPLAQDQWIYLLSLCLLLLMFWFCRNLLHGRIGRAMTAMRNHEVAAATSGVNVPAYKLLAFAFGSMFAGVGGAVFVLVTQFANPDSFSLVLSITFLTGGIIGGIDSAVGAILGALFVEFVPVVTSDMAMAHDFPPAIIYAIVLVAVIFLMPDGLVGLAARVRRRRSAVNRVDGVDRAAGAVPSMQEELAR
ncbi:MAG TPA: branched-chain amino acid ABC transporter permease [Acetobacteraceae bacterium]|nr:branched-chain amino acid ABC transporter permease [Acetobacteraceae bacterium]